MKFEELLEKEYYDLHYKDIQHFIVVKGLKNVTVDEMEKMIEHFGDRVLDINGFVELYNVVSANRTNKTMRNWTVGIGLMTFVMTILTLINLFIAFYKK